MCYYFFQAEDCIRVGHVTGVQTCALPIFRLTEIGYQAGTVANERYKKYEGKKRLVEQEKKRLNKLIIKPSEDMNKFLEGKGTSLKEAVKAYDLLRRPEISYENIESILMPASDLPEEVKEQVGIQIK